jgi:predicted dehydrogenase
MQDSAGIEPHPSRRNFLTTSAGAVVAGATLERAIATRSYAGEEHTIPIALVGCGGRGTGAATQALSTKGPTRLVAMADVFEDRLKDSLDQLTQQHSPQLEVARDRQFLGTDAYRKAIDCVAPGGVVLLATPPAFRPIHVEYAVSRGCHVFMEKSFGVDAPGVRRILKAGEAAKTRNLKIAGGLMSRHYKPLEEAVEQIHKGAIGDVMTCYAYRMHSPVGLDPGRPGENELAHQIRNYSNFTWLTGSFLLDWLIHNLDICCWVKGAWPVACQGQGGRQVRTLPDQLFDHYLVEYSFPDGTRLMAEGRHMDQCWGFFGDVIHGSKGCAVLGEGVTEPRLYPELWPQLFSDVNCIALWISSDKILTRLYSVLHWFHKRLEMNVKNPRENRCFQNVIVCSCCSVDNSNTCAVLLNIAVRLITVSTSVNNEMWVKLSSIRDISPPPRT